MSQIVLPDQLYDAKDLDIHGTPRVSGYWMRIRIEHLLAQPEGSLGLRRAMHACILSEVVINAFFGPHEGPRADRLFGYFPRALTQEVVNRLIASKATLRTDEQHYADIGWWGRLDQERASVQLENNLLRMIFDEPTVCLLLGIELQVLLDINMRSRHGTKYPSVVAKYATARSPILVQVRDRISSLLEPVAA